jgi:Toxin PAAR-like domain
MGKNVFANGREISGKADDNESIAGMPDVCLSPPSPPAGPLPIPYPNFSNAKDTTNGSKSVKIGGQEVGQKDKSYYKTSKGDEAATRGLGMGVVTHTIQGKTYHAAWSMDVMVEGENVIRHLDMTTHNHASQPANPPAMTVDVGGMAVTITPDDCKELHQKNGDERSRLSNAPQKRDPTQEHQTVQTAASGNTTITHGTFTGATGASQGFKAASKGVIHLYDNGFTQGLTSDEIAQQTTTGSDGKDKVKSGACGGHEYKKTSMPHTSHTEARIIEEIFKAQPKPTSGLLVLAVNWPGGPAKGKRTSDPCEACRQLVCAVSKPEPGCLDIVFCSDKGVPEKPECD